MTTAAVSRQISHPALFTAALLLAGCGALAVHARVLAVDPSYRLLKLQYTDGENETVKVPLGTRIEQMAAGDSVVIRPVDVIALRRKG